MDTPKKYKSLEEAIKASDFPEFLSLLNTYYIGKPEFNKLMQYEDDSEYRHIDKLLSFIPKYSIAARKAVDIAKNDPVEFLPGALEATNKLLELGANPNLGRKNRITPFLLSCKINNIELAQLFLDNPYQKVDLYTADASGNKALYYAAIASADLVMDYLVKEKNFDINATYIFTNNRTVLHHACAQAKEKSIDKLIELGADPRIRDNHDNLASECIPALTPGFTEEDYEEGQLELWDSLFEKVEAYRESYQEKAKVNYKTNF